MSSQPIPQKYSWEWKKKFNEIFWHYTVCSHCKSELLDLKFSLFMSKDTNLLFFQIFLEKMSVLSFLLNYIEMKCSDMPKEKKSFLLNLLEWHKILCFIAIQFETSTWWQHHLISQECWLLPSSHHSGWTLIRSHKKAWKSPDAAHSVTKHGRLNKGKLWTLSLHWQALHSWNSISIKLR